MRRFLVALTATATLTFTAVPAAGAAEALESLPAEAKLGSSAMENLSAGGSSDDTLDDVLDLGKDWLLGAALVTIAGGLVTLVSTVR
ncbi:hypothetical protein [Corynebacterium halotolerans]|uniref:hypothetical protein n=1 Tax=Corynebacterium halotolerans TaxID=225326 RepID=UPI003CEDA7DE